MLESGCVSLKNEVNIMMKNVVDVVFGGLTYWAFGYGLSYGTDAGSSPFMGVGSWFVNSEGLAMGQTYTTFLFQLSFATTATNIVSGAIAERYSTFPPVSTRRFVPRLITIVCLFADLGLECQKLFCLLLVICHHSYYHRLWCHC